MAQNTITIADGRGDQVLSELNGAFPTLASLFSGPAAPANPLGYQLWVDTANNLLKQANAAASAWNVVGVFDANQNLYPVNGAAPLSSVAALRAWAAQPLPVLYLRGWYADGDGGEGFFRYDASDTTSPDNGGTVLVDAAGHRYKRNLEGAAPTNRMFGAKADGVTDDTAATQALIAWCKANGYREAWIIPGTGPSIINAPLELAAGGGVSLECVSLRGLGSVDRDCSAGAVLKAGTALGGNPIVQVTGWSGGRVNCRVENIGFLGQGSADGNCCVAFRGVDGAVGRGLVFKDVQYGGRFENPTSGAFTEQCVFHDVIFDSTVTQPFHYLRSASGPGCTSFRGSGFIGARGTLAAGSSLVLVQDKSGTNDATLYNAPFDCDVDTVAVAANAYLTLVRLDPTYYPGVPLRTWGTIRSEAASGTAPFDTTGYLPSYGHAWKHAGPAEITGPVFDLGGLWHTARLVSTFGPGPANTTGSITSGTDTLNVASASGVAIGMEVTVAGAGPSGADLDAFITGLSGTTLTLNKSAGTTVSGAAVTFLPDEGYNGLTVETPRDQRYKFTMVSSGQALFVFPDDWALLSVWVKGTGFDINFLLYVTAHLGGGVGNVAVLSTWAQDNSAGITVPTWSVDSGSHLVITCGSAGFSPATVEVAYRPFAAMNGLPPMVG